MRVDLTSMSPADHLLEFSIKYFDLSRVTPKGQPWFIIFRDLDVKVTPESFFTKRFYKVIPKSSFTVRGWVDVKVTPESSFTKILQYIIRGWADLKITPESSFTKIMYIFTQGCAGLKVILDSSFMKVFYQLR